MKALTTYINEKLVLNKDTFRYQYFPKTTQELRDILKKLLQERKDDDIIDLNDIDTSNITDMRSLFLQQYNIKRINISKWNVTRVKDISGMFAYCDNLISIGDLSSWDVSRVIDMSYMFYSCRKLKHVGDLSDWNISNVKKIIDMFTGSGIKNKPSWYKK